VVCGVCVCVCGVCVWCVLCGARCVCVCVCGVCVVRGVCVCVWCVCVCGVLCVCVCVCVCVCGFSYPAHKAHAPYYTVICGMCGATIFFHSILKMARFFGEKAFHMKCVFWNTPKTSVCNISHSKKNPMRYYYKCRQAFMYSIRHSWEIFIELDVSKHIFGGGGGHTKKNTKKFGQL